MSHLGQNLDLWDCRVLSVENFTLELQLMKHGNKPDIRFGWIDH